MTYLQDVYKRHSAAAELLEEKRARYASFAATWEPANEGQKRWEEYREALTKFQVLDQLLRDLAKSAQDSRLQGK